MEGICFVVERIEWEERIRESQSNRWELRNICRVFGNYKDAKSFVEANAKSIVCNFPCDWHGDYEYSGQSNDEVHREGLLYRIHFVKFEI